jgi:hypothetical protein
VHYYAAIKEKHSSFDHGRNNIRRKDSVIWELLAIRKGTCSPSSPIDDGNGIPVPSPS